MAITAAIRTPTNLAPSPAYQIRWRGFKIRDYIIEVSTLV